MRGWKSTDTENSTYCTRPKIDSILDLSIFEPRSALFLPNRGLVEGVEVRIDLVQCILFDGHCFDAFRLHLSHAFDAVFDRCFDGWQERAVAPGRTRANNGIVVGEPRGRYTKVKVRSVHPVLLNGFAGSVDHLERRLEGDLEARRTHQNIHRVGLAIDGLDSFGDYLFDTIENGGDILLHQCLEVSVAG